MKNFFTKPTIKFTAFEALALFMIIVAQYQEWSETIQWIIAGLVFISIVYKTFKES